MGEELGAGRKPRILESTVFLKSLRSIHRLKVIGNRKTLEIADRNDAPESYSVAL